MYKIGNSLLCISWPRNTVFRQQLSNAMSDHHEIFTQFFLNYEVFFSSHIMFINAPTKEFTLTHFVTFSISRSRIRMKFYFVYRLVRLWKKCL